MTDNNKSQSAVALPATHPETFYPTYSEWDLKQILDGGSPSTYLSTNNFDKATDSGSNYVQPYAIPVNIPILTKAQVRDALRQLLMNKQALFAKRYAEEQAKLFEELQKLTAIGYEEEVLPNIETPEVEEADRLQAQAEADAKAEFVDPHEAPDIDYPNKYYGTSISPTYPEDE